MAESEKQSFWTTLPGILTGIAALLTAVTGLMIAFYSHGPSAAKDAAGSGNEAAKSAQVEGASPPSAASVPQQTQKNTVLVTAKDGTETRLSLKSFKDSYSGSEMIQLRSGQSIAFEKMKSIDFLGAPDSDENIRVTLLDGRKIEGAIMPGERIAGESDLGPFSTAVTNLKQVVFER